MKITKLSRILLGTFGLFSFSASAVQAVETEAGGSKQAVLAQLALKYDFERADSVANWRQDLPAGASPDTVTLDTLGNYSHSGQGALKFEITSDRNESRHVYAGANFTNNATSKEGVGRLLRLRLFVRTENIASNSVTVQILERDATSVTGWLSQKQEFVSIQPSKEWQAYEATGILAASTRVVTLFVAINQPRAGQKIWIDDLSLEVVQPAAQ